MWCFGVSLNVRLFKESVGEGDRKIANQRAHDKRTWKCGRRRFLIINRFAYRVYTFRTCTVYSVRCAPVQYRKWYRGESRMIPRTLRFYLESPFDLSGVSFWRQRIQRWFRSTYVNSEGKKSTSKYDKNVPDGMLNFYAIRPKIPGA